MKQDRESYFQHIQEHVNSYERGRRDERETIDLIIKGLCSRYARAAQDLPEGHDRLLHAACNVALAEVRVEIARRRKSGEKIMKALSTEGVEGDEVEETCGSCSELATAMVTDGGLFCDSCGVKHLMFTFMLPEWKARELWFDFWLDLPK